MPFLQGGLQGTKQGKLKVTATFHKCFDGLFDVSFRVRKEAVQPGRITPVSLDKIFVSLEHKDLTLCKIFTSHIAVG